MSAGSSTASTGSGTDEQSTDRYIGSFITLTSKSEIRYEGILYNINTDEASIGLRNVRSYGTEGRKTDGQQVPPSDSVYEYILFRGTDIKDLQVKKTSPPAQATPPSINSDPAIIQSQYPGATTPPASLPTASSTYMTDLGSHSSQMGSTYQSGLPLYQPGGNMNSWGASPPNIPMYYPGFCGTPYGIPQIPQQSLQRPPHDLSLPPSLQHMQFPGFNPSLPISSTLPSSNLPEYHSLVPNITSPFNLSSSSLPASFSLNAPPPQPIPLPSETMLNFMPNRTIPTIATSAPSSSLPSLTPLSDSVPHNAPVPSSVSKPIVTTGPSALASQTLSSQPIRTESTKPSFTFITPAELLQPVHQSLPTSQKDVESVQVSPKRSSGQSIPVVTQAQPPILPLPTNARPHKPNEDSYHNVRNHYRGRGARGPGGRGPGISRPEAKFTEEFDFTAMNEKFNKDEVWGLLGKSNKYQSNDKDENNFGGYEEYPEDEYDSELPKTEIKPLYQKDDFFDSLSSNALDNAHNHTRPKYSELLKLDAETFGEFSRSRGGRGGRGGGGRFRGSYSGGRGYDGYGYGDQGRGRGGYADRGRGRGRSRGGYGDRGRGRGEYGDGGLGLGGYGDSGRGRGRGA